MQSLFFVGETARFLLLSQVGLGTSPSRLFPVEQCSKLILIWAYTIHYIVIRKRDIIHYKAGLYNILLGLYYVIYYMGLYYIGDYTKD